MSLYYQNIPEKLDPIAFSIGSFEVRWYAICYLASFLLAILIVYWRILRNEDRHIFKEESIKKRMDFFLDLFLIGFLGMIVGGRIGYVLFYDPKFYLSNPLSIISPFDTLTGAYQGIFGMSYFGALVGAVVFGWAFLKGRGLDFWRVADFIIPSAAGAYALGRFGNFINGELFGRKTDFFLGMRFDGERFLRHPSQLYEAFFEGILIFAFLWLIRNKARFDGQIMLSYMILYAVFRFFIEFFREPGVGEAVFGSMLTKGQIFSIILFFFGSVEYFRKIEKSAIIQRK